MSAADAPMTEAQFEAAAENFASADRVDELETRLAEVEERDARKDAVIEAQADRIAELEDDQSEHRDQSGRDRAEIRREVTGLRETIDTQARDAAEDRKRISELESAENAPAPEDQRDQYVSDNEEQLARDLVPLELMSIYGPSYIRASPQVQELRAHITFRGLVKENWGTGNPAGERVIKTGRLKDLLNERTDKRLDYKQIHRACLSAEELAPGVIEYRQRGRGKSNALVLCEPAAIGSRLEESAGAGTDRVGGHPSSAGEGGGTA